MGFSVIDGFLDDFCAIRQHCDSLDYSGEINPYDGVMYPGISFDIPEDIRREVIEKLDAKNPKMFLRITYKDATVPHSAHNDVLMSKKGCIIYMNRDEHCAGGTSFVSHKTVGMDTGPKTADEEAIWLRDTNDIDAWAVNDFVGMKSNRALIFDTEMMHRAEHPAAFGSCGENGRLVMVCFYD